MKTAQTYKIDVTVEKDSIRVTPDPLVMTSDDEVHWAGTNPRKFSLVFDDAAPFGQRELPHSFVTTRQRPRAKGRFKYTVVSEENPGLQLDPVIVIEEPSTGPNP